MIASPKDVDGSHIRHQNSTTLVGVSRFAALARLAAQAKVGGDHLLSNGVQVLLVSLERLHSSILAKARLEEVTVQRANKLYVWGVCGVWLLRGFPNTNTITITTLVPSCGLVR